MLVHVVWLMRWPHAPMLTEKIVAKGFHPHLQDLLTRLTFNRFYGTLAYVAYAYCELRVEAGRDAFLLQLLFSDKPRVGSSGSCRETRGPVRP